MSKYVITKTSNNQFRWKLIAENGQTLITSETYTTKQSCFDGVASSKAHIEDRYFDRNTSISNEPYFNQIASNGQTLGTSEMYSSTANRDNGIESVKTNAPVATIEDLS